MNSKETSKTNKTARGKSDLRPKSELHIWHERNPKTGGLRFCKRWVAINRD